jgi:hypothetical protein
MNITAFCKILQEATVLYRSGSERKAHDDIELLISRLKPFGTMPLPAFFTFDSSNRETGRVIADGVSAVSVSTLARIIEQTSRLLRAAGSNAKANELAAVANDLGKHGDISVSDLADGVEQARAQETHRLVQSFVDRLNGTERDTEAFEKIIVEIGRLNAQLAIRVAAAYVEGRSKYASKPKALAAIRNKQYAQERFLHKTGKS